jgi:hypothetical protein
MDYRVASPGGHYTAQLYSGSGSIESGASGTLSPKEPTHWLRGRGHLVPIVAPIVVEIIFSIVRLVVIKNNNIII